MSFLYPWVLIGLVALPPLAWAVVAKAEPLRNHFAPRLYNRMVIGGAQTRWRAWAVLGAIGFSLVALARPVIERAPIRVEAPAGRLIAAFDISRSMQAADPYPSRLDLAKRKFAELLDDLKRTEVGVIAFSSRAYLVAPLTEDYASLRYLVKKMGLGYVMRRGTDLTSAVQAALSRLKGEGPKRLLIFTDGGDDTNFDEAIALAKKGGLRVDIYAIGTARGAPIPLEGGGVMKDARGRPVITRLNPDVRRLAEATGGVYMTFSLGKEDMSELAGFIESGYGKKGDTKTVIHDRRELFYLPAAVALALLSLSYLSPPRKERK